MKNIFFYKFKNCNLLPCGIFIAEDDGSICRLSFAKEKNYKKLKKDCEYKIKETPLIKRAAKQLDEYFNKKRKTFDLPLKPEGTDFQKKVWKALQRIPYGTTASYGEIAAAIGNHKASRAVGMANNRNPIAIIIPCHRVIGADGSLVGYAGGLEIKKILLELENAI